MTATDTTLDAPPVQQPILLQVAVDQGNRIVRVRCAAISGTDTASRKDFLERVFSAADVDWVDLRFNEATALIHCAEGGLPFADQISKLALAVRGEDRELNLSLPQDCFEQANIRVSIFVDPIEKMIEAAASTGTDRIELYTEMYAKQFAAGNKEKAIAPYMSAAALAKKLGLGINAGHDLDRFNLPYLIQSIPSIDEVSIGHALISDALYLGLENTIQLYKRALDQQ